MFCLSANVRNVYVSGETGQKRNLSKINKRLIELGDSRLNIMKYFFVNIIR